MWRHELINQEMTFWEFNNLAENITVSHRLQCGGQKRLEARKKIIHSANIKHLLYSRLWTRNTLTFFLGDLYTRKRDRHQRKQIPERQALHRRRCQHAVEIWWALGGEHTSSWGRNSCAGFWLRLYPKTMVFSHERGRNLTLFWKYYLICSIRF